MGKRIKWSEFKKGDITALKRDGKFQREIQKALQQNRVKPLSVITWKV